jgi:hypothetical protein
MFTLDSKGDGPNVKLEPRGVRNLLGERNTENMFEDLEDLHRNFYQAITSEVLRNIKRYDRRMAEDITHFEVRKWALYHRDQLREWFKDAGMYETYCCIEKPDGELTKCTPDQDEEIEPIYVFAITNSFVERFVDNFVTQRLDPDASDVESSESDETDTDTESYDSDESEFA